MAQTTVSSTPPVPLQRAADDLEGRVLPVKARHLKLVDRTVGDGVPREHDLPAARR